MKKEATVHHISTDKPSLLVKLKMFGGDRFNYSKVVLPIQDEEEYQHLYVTDDSEIKVGDKFLWFLNGTFRVMVHVDDAAFTGDGKKIIATTDPDVNRCSICKKQEGVVYQYQTHNCAAVPQIQQSFIEAWCKKPVDKVLVEYTSTEIGEFDGVIAYDWDCIPKLTANNELIIHMIEEKLYTREEMWRCVAQSHMARKNMKNPFDEIPEWFDNWIKEN